MEHPFRHSENEQIIIDSRLSTLEKKAASQTAWRRVGILTCLAFAVLHAVVLLNVRRPTEPAACHDTVKTVAIGVFKSDAEVSCNHPSHRGTLVEHTHWATTLQCVCQ